MISAKFRTELNATLDAIATALDLDETRYQNAEDKYKAIGRWLEAEDSSLVSYRPVIYPQGSFILGTTVKPISSKEDYDIDLVCTLSGVSDAPAQIKKIVGERLRDHDGYRKRLEEKNRCWRINYAGEFHLDILPAIPTPTGTNTAIRVPDKELKQWKESDPKGYAAWFRSRMEDQFLLIRKSLAELELKRIEEIPEFKVKTPLQRAVQLMKRNRDVFFIDDESDKPISIIITTLAGLSYNNQDDILSALIALSREMPNHIKYQDEVAWIANPVNHHENFADKWQHHPNRRAAFLDWLETFSLELASLGAVDSLSGAETHLTKLFGEQAAKNAVAGVQPKKQVYLTPNLKKAPPVINIKNPSKPWGVNDKP